MTEKKLAGKVAVITGAARGLGRGYAHRLASLGADIAIVDRNMRAAEVYAFDKKQTTEATTMEECSALGVRSIGVEADLTDRDATEKAIAEIAEKMGRIDIVVCNAGGGIATFADERTEGGGDINTNGTAANCDQKTLTRILDINLMSCMYTCMAVAPYMIKQKSGKIVTTSSVAGLVTNEGTYHPYGIAKSAIIHYTCCLAQELGPQGINVNCIAPGVIRTGRLGDRADEVQDIPLRRVGNIEDCAKVVEFLVTDLSDYVTGKTITVDGGVCEQR